MQVEFDYKLKCLQVNTLIQRTIEVLFCFGINIGIEDELKDLPEIFSTGDSIDYDLNLLKALKDPVVKHIVDLIEELEHLRGVMMLINGISISESNESVENLIGREYWPAQEQWWESIDPWSIRNALLEYLLKTNSSMFSLAVQMIESRMDGTIFQSSDQYDNIHRALALARQKDPTITLMIQSMQIIMKSYQRISTITDRDFL